MRRAALAVAGLMVLACGRQSAERTVVAELGDLRLTRADLDAALAAELVQGAPLEGSDRDRVCSRLLDGVLDETLLASEAGRRGVTVSPAEVAAYLSDVSSGGAVSDPQGARRHLAARKLQDALLRAVGPPSEEEVLALADRLRSQDEAAGASVVLRALRLASDEEAAAVRRRIEMGETTFDREANARDAEAAAPLQVSLARLPAEVGAALSTLEPGQVTAPVRLHAGAYLFELLSRGPVATQARDLEAEARDDLLRRRGEMAARALLLELRRQRPLRLHRDRLGFRYLEDGG